MSMKLMRGFSGGLDVEIKNSPDLRIAQVNVQTSLNKKWVSQKRENQLEPCGRLLGSLEFCCDSSFPS